MKCVNCQNEMEKGKSSLMTVSGIGQIILSFVSDAEQDKGFFKRKTHDNIIMSAEEFEGYYCPKCGTTITITKEDK